MEAVSIFVDFENATFVLQNREGKQFIPRLFGEKLKKFAENFGKVEKALIWAEWNKFSSPFSQERAIPLILGEQEFDCIYLPNSSDRNYIERSINKLLTPAAEKEETIVLVSGDYLFENLLQNFKNKKFILLLVGEVPASFPWENAEVRQLWEVLEKEEVTADIELPSNLNMADFFIQLQRLLKEELQRRRWDGMSFHMLSRLMVENMMANNESEAQYYINHAVYKGFLERFESELPSGQRILFKPTIIEHFTDESVWKEDEFVFAQLVWAFDIIFHQNPWWEYVTFSRLREELARWSLIKPHHNLQLVVENAVEKGILNLTIEDSDPYSNRKKYKYTLGDVESFSPLLRLLPRTIVKTVRNLLRENPSWSGVSFNKLLESVEREILHDPQFTQRNIWLDRITLKNWSNFLCDLGVLHAFRGRPRIVQGEIKESPTLVRVVPEHPWVKLIDAQNSYGQPPSASSHYSKIKDIHLYRLIILIEHYLYISDNDAVLAGWMPMATIFKVMGRSLERNFCNAIVRTGNDRKIIEIRTYDPRPGQHPPRGAQLNFGHPMIREARKKLIRCLKIFLQIQDENSEVSLEKFREHIADDPFLGETVEERLEWIDIMRQENLIILKPKTNREEPGKLEYSCNLNIRDRYILFLLDSIQSQDGEASGEEVLSSVKEGVSISNDDLQALDEISKPQN